MATTTDNAATRVTGEELARRARRKELRDRWMWRILGYVAVLGAWEFVSGRFLEEALLPGPTRVIRTFGEIWSSGKLPGAFADTLTRLFIGFGLSFIIGAVIGIISQNRWWEGYFRDATLVGLTAPGLIWALITAIVFGNRIWGPLLAIIFTTFGLVTVNVYEGVKSLPKELMDMSRAFHVPGAIRQRHIVVPHLAPFLFTGMRFGFSIAWKVTVLTEVFSSSSGIGFEMRVSSQLFQMDEFLTWILAFFLFALFLEKVVLQAFENRFFRWRQAVSAQ